MKLAAICCTYKRPQQLARLIGCFLAQDHPDRELVILDDAGQYDTQEGDGWRLVSIPERYPTLGDKRNAAMGLVSRDVDALAVWDDDDCYLPWALSACAAGLERQPWVRPSQILIAQDGALQRFQTFRPGRPDRKLFHAAWAFGRDCFRKIGGYAPIGSGEDQHLMTRLVMAGVCDCDPIDLGHEPYAVISWDHVPKGAAPKLSWMDAGAWGVLGRLPAPHVAGAIEPTLPDHFDYSNPLILPAVKPRPF